MTRIALALAAALTLSAVAPTPLAGVAHAKKPAEVAPQVVMVNLKHGTDDLHAVVMALKLGEALAEKGADVTMFLNLEAARLASKRQPLELRWGPGDATVQTLLDEYRAAGGKIIVCPHCAMAAGIGADDLREGMVIPSESDVADLIVAADKILDY